mmetsp:Transcript_20075/g.39233  ORF Transcript_20075/g.39233 Transcript_20075/m.39233 type:complete len:594 (-) Transcript_20075:117-1898(-)
MGGSTSAGKAGQQSISTDTAPFQRFKTNAVVVTGRYHKPPKKLEDDYRVSSEVLGDGMNGSVFKATSLHNDGTYAVKGFQLVGLSSDKRQRLQNEAEIFLAMDHPHVARLVAVYDNSNTMQLVMECMEGGELFDRLVAAKVYSVADAAHAVWQMLLAINYIHSHGVVHRDLKLENFLYELKTNDHLKLIDFGFSKVWERNTKMAATCGTLSYMSPEVVTGAYTSQSDLWSLGVITFILLLGYMPFSGPELKQLELIKKGRYRIKAEPWERLPATAQDFIQNLLALDYTKRMTAAQALKHTFIADRCQRGRRYVTPLAVLNVEESGAEGGAVPSGASLNVDTEVVDALANFSQASRFRRACLSLMAWSLTAEERAQVRDAFIELDVKREGKIKLCEVKQVLEKCFNAEDEHVKTVLLSVENMGDEELHYTDFLAAMVSSRIAMHEDLLMATFKKFDKENTGVINKDNLRAVLGNSVTEAEVEEIMSQVDLSSSGSISYEDFISYLRGGHANAEHESIAAKVIDYQVSANPQGDQQQLPEVIQPKIREAGTVSRLISAPSHRAMSHRRLTAGPEVLSQGAEPTPKKNKSRFCEIM